MSQLTCDRCNITFEAKTVSAVKRVLTMHKKKCVIQEEIKEEQKTPASAPVILSVENNIGTINISPITPKVLPRCKTCQMCRC